MFVSTFRVLSLFFFFFFNDTATTEIYTLSLHDALPISFFGLRILSALLLLFLWWLFTAPWGRRHYKALGIDRKSTRLNSSHSQISYAVFCLKKKNTTTYASCLHSWIVSSACRDSKRSCL